MNYTVTKIGTPTEVEISYLEGDDVVGVLAPGGGVLTPEQAYQAGVALIRAADALGFEPPTGPINGPGDIICMVAR